MKTRLFEARTFILGLYLLLGCAYAPTTLALGEEATGYSGNMNETMHKDVDSEPWSYFSFPDDRDLMFAHIAFMTFAWIVVLPVAVMLSIAACRYTLTTQIAFIAVNILGVLIAVLYNANTPDLYPNNVHHKIGWIITAACAAHTIVGALTRRKVVQSNLNGVQQTQEQTFFTMAGIPDDQGYTDVSQESRLSTDSNLESLAGSLSRLGEYSNTNQSEISEDNIALATSRTIGSKRHDRRGGYFSTILNLLGNLHWMITTQSLWACIGYAYKTTDRIILPFGFIAFTTGIATFGRLFEGDAIYNGLAHWIKGGVLFWFGLFTLGRWAGSFAALGWAWNIRPRRKNCKILLSAEFLESFLIFFYGSTNIFLEHLGNSDGKWRAKDLEHLAITVLFIGGGLCGMLVESISIRNLLNATVRVHSYAQGNLSKRMKQPCAPASSSVSLNPIPALVICLLGSMMGSHHQATMTSNMVHKQWGNLLLGASFARCLTYILMYIRPPTSILPSRPPTELLVSFGLIAGGIVLMASSTDTVESMIQNNLDAMFLYTITMGLVGILMAWEVIVLAIKGLAIRKENLQALCR